MMNHNFFNATFKRKCVTLFRLASLKLMQQRKRKASSSQISSWFRLKWFATNNPHGRSREAAVDRILICDKGHTSLPQYSHCYICYLVQTLEVQIFNFSVWEGGISHTPHLSHHDKEAARCQLQASACFPRTFKAHHRWHLLAAHLTFI